MAAYGKCFDPAGARFGVPTFPWPFAPDGYATRRQLRERGLRPGGQPVRPMTSRKWGALALAMLARRTCPKCRVTYSYCLPTSLGMCILCAYPDTTQSANSASPRST